MEQSKELVVINNRLTETIGFVKKIFGDKLSPAPIVDDKTFNVVQDNIITVKNIDKAVDEYYDPKIAEARKPYDKLLEEKKAWKTPLKNLREFLDDRTGDWNDRKREEIRIKEQAEADARAAADREKLESVKEQAKAAGNVELVEQIEQEKQEIIAAPVAEKIMVNRNSLSTSSEKKIIKDFRITNVLNFINACIAQSFGGCLYLDPKTDTAFMKILLANESIKDFPGTAWRRGYAPINIKKKSG